MIKFYVVGYGIPALIVIVTTTVSIVTDGFLYLRRDDENRVNSCFLGGNAIFAMVIPAGLVVLLNTGVTVIAVIIAHKAGKRRNVGGQAQAISMLRNTLLISLLLGLTWMVGFLPTSTLQQYITVCLNASMGIYILFYSVLANTQERLH
ncbi:adhesion G-protein coupled receptor G2, partial [Eurytemora carolleeae]|uniref:adhesion G-protein coupled receptor G2 n=1 Tax=Eurytemora carolleeae TaxID=1294199 RepID=UPI000C7655BE